MATIAASMTDSGLLADSSIAAIAPARDDGAWLGRYRPGDQVTGCLLTDTSSGAASVPDSIPTYAVYSSGMVVVASGSAPVCNKYSQPGMFSLRLPLGASYSAGKYFLVWSYSVSGVLYLKCDVFEVMSGGDPTGSVLSLYYFVLPASSYIVGHLSSGRLAIGRNPTI